MKQLFFLTALSFCTMTVFAQEVPELEPTFSAIKSFFLPALGGSVVALLTDAKKYWFTGKWSWSVFFNTKLTPFLLVNVGAILAYLLIAWMPWSKNILEVLAGSELAELTAFGLIGLAQAAVDGLWKNRKTDDEE